MLIPLVSFLGKIPKLLWMGRGGGEGSVSCQLRTSNSGVSVDQNWMFVDRGEEGVGVGILDFFSERHK